jgi:hypothetical protein
MKPIPISFVKYATIYKSKEFISVEPLSGASGLHYREDENHRIYLEPDATDDALGAVLLEALGRSRFIDPVQQRDFFNRDRATRVYENWQKDFTARYGYKSKREAHKSLDWCMARMSEENISIEPHGRDKPGYWRSLPEERTVIVPATTDVAVAGAAMRLALDRCG